MLERKAIHELTRFILGIDAVAQIDQTLPDVACQHIASSRQDLAPGRFEVR